MELVTVDVVGGNSGLARLDDEAMPIPLPLPYGLVAGDLAGVLNGVYDSPVILATAMVPINVADIPSEKPANGVGNWQDTSGAARWRIWKDEDGIKVDWLFDNMDSTVYFTSITIQIPVAKAAELGLTEPEQDYGTTAGGVVWGCPNRRPDRAANRIRRRRGQRPRRTHNHPIQSARNKTTHRRRSRRYQRRRR